MRESLFWIAVLSCAAGQLLIIRSTWRARERAATGPVPAGVPRPRAASEIAWVVLPALMLAVVLLFTWRAIREPVAPAPRADRHAMPMSPL